MNKLDILCVDDHREVLAALRKDLEKFEQWFEIDECESASEAYELMEQLHSENKIPAIIICDHVMPGQNGIDFLVQINGEKRFDGVKKVVLTGLATHQDTIIAINKAGIDRYVEKPWYSDELQDMVKVLATEFILEKGMEYTDFHEIIDKETLYDALNKTY
ncbi:MAG: response regulator [Melioribacteraceae bacterium]|nr:MAG: response regulator [Melioribacteraceae bacterium]